MAFKEVLNKVDFIAQEHAILKFWDDVCEGRVDVEQLFELADSPEVGSDELLEDLRPLPGIGPSSSHFLSVCPGAL